jgi:cytochrome c nitrite reductase small subunit
MNEETAKKWKIAGLIAVIILVGAAAGTATITSTDTFCVGCHAYEKVSWDHGDHPDVGCVSCHTKGMMTDKVKGVKKVFLTMTGQVNPHNSKLPSYKEALTENCTRCHLSAESAAAHPIYKERHEEYVKHAAGCVSCHEPGHVKKLRGLREVASRR